jgi:hypothetical protein
MRSSHRWVRAGWVRCTARATRVWIAWSQSDPNSPTAMSAPEVGSEELNRLRKRRDEIQQMLDEDSSEEDMRARVL